MKIWVLAALLWPVASFGQELAGSWDLAGYVCESGGDFRLVPIPEQLQVSAGWQINSDGTMSLEAFMERDGGGSCTLRVNGTYEVQGSTFSYTVKQSTGDCPAPEGETDSIEDFIVEDQFLYLPSPENLSGGAAACSNGRIYQAFVRQ